MPALVSMKQLVCPSKRALSGCAGQEAAHVGHQDAALEVGHRSRLGRRHVGGVAEGEHVGCGPGLERGPVDGDEAEFVAETGGAPDVGGAAVQRDDHGQVERDPAAVVGDQPAVPGPGCVYLARVELGDQADALGDQQAAQFPVADRLGEGAVQGRHVPDPDPVPQAAPPEVVVREEAELQRRDRALDRHVHDVDHDPAVGEPLQRRVQRRRPVGRVEREHVFHPAGPGQPFGFPGQKAGSGGHHEDVVVQDAPAIEVHAVTGQVNVVDPGVAEGNAIAELPLPQPDEMGQVSQAERHEQQTGLVDVLGVLVDHHDLGVLRRVGPAQPVRGQGSARAPAQDHDALHTFHPAMRARDAVRAVGPGAR